MAQKSNGKLSPLTAKKGFKPLLLVIVCLAIVGIIVGLIFSENQPTEITVEEAQTIIDDSYNNMLNDLSRSSAKYIVDNSSIKVNSVSYGSNKEIYADCSVTTINSGEVLGGHINDLLATNTLDVNGKPMVSTKLKLTLDGEILEYLKQEAKSISVNSYRVIICDTSNGFQVYNSKKMIDTCFGGIASFQDKINDVKTVMVAGTETKVETNLKNGVNECVQFVYSVQRPTTATGLLKIWNSIKTEFQRNFLSHNYWKYIVSGLKITIEVACLAVLIGVSLGFITAIIRCTYDKTGKLKILNGLAKLYLTVFRGTPVVVQLMIIYFVIFMPMGVNKVLAAIICFGVNSGAYVCEIVRGGIMSVDEGQMEAGRSLGFNYVQTMWHIIIPQAFKSVLPALANEFIVLLKETSVVGYIGLNDLTRGGDIIKSKTYSAFMPLIIVAIIYLVMVMILSKLVGLLERRLRNSER